MINSLAAIRTDSTRAFVTASGVAVQLYRRHSGTTLLKAEQHSPSFDVPEEGWTGIPYLDAVATLSDNGEKLFLHLINLHPE
jgi:alpha-L-arabinofuranosidase